MEKLFLSKEMMLNENIEVILTQIKPIIIFHTKKIMKTIFTYSKIKIEIYDDIFQELQIAAWYAIKNFDIKKSNNPYYFISVALNNAAKVFIKKYITKHNKESFALYNYIIIEGERNPINRSIIHNIEVSDLMKKLPKKMGHIYKKVVNHEVLSNKDRVVFKSFIKKHPRYMERLKDYFLNATF